MSKLTSKIAIIGAGDVGSAIAFSLLHNATAAEILLIDPKSTLRDAQVQDLSDVTYHGATSTRVRAGTHREAGQCDIIVITAGAKQKQGETRTSLIGRNHAILTSCINDMKPFKENAILLLVANPVDVLTYFAQKLSGLPRSQVLGTGTFLDSARLRGYLAEKIGVAASSIDAFVFGEHGDSQFVAWSLATIGGIPLSRAFPIDSLDLPGLAKATREKAAFIIEHKGATAFGIGGVAASICKSILFDHRNIRPISHFVDDLDCCLSLPVVLGREGVVRTIPCPFDDVEKKDLEESARSLRAVIKSVETVQS